MREAADGTFSVCPCMSCCASRSCPAACAGSHARPGDEGTWSKARLMLPGEALNVQAGAPGERAAK